MLNGPANPITLGDNSGAGSTIGGYTQGDHTLTGVISGSGGLAMSRFTGWNGGSQQTVNIRLAGTASNTYTGVTVVDGQGAGANRAALWLQKTGGAVAVAGGDTVQFGSNTGGTAALYMGGNNQFGTTNGGVVLDWVNTGGAWNMYFGLKGTSQSVAVT